MGFFDLWGDGHGGLLCEGDGDGSATFLRGRLLAHDEAIIEASRSSSRVRGQFGGDFFSAAQDPVSKTHHGDEATCPKCGVEVGTAALRGHLCLDLEVQHEAAPSTAHIAPPEWVIEVIVRFSITCAG